MILIEFFRRLWKSPVNLIFAVVVVLLIVWSGILDAQYIEGPAPPIERCVGSLGAGGGFMLLGINMFVLVPTDANAYVRLRWCGVAAMAVGGGALLLWNGLPDCVTVCVP
jgi:hypothetical protein